MDRTFAALVVVDVAHLGHAGPGDRPRTPTAPAGPSLSAPMRRGGRLLGAAGAAGLLAALILDAHDTGSAASQVWSPFVLVAGLILVGLVAEGDGLFRAAGYRIARLARSGAGLFAGASLLVALVTAVLNLDTSVVFLTPVLVHAARAVAMTRAPCSTAAFSCPTPPPCCCPGPT